MADRKRYRLNGAVVNVCSMDAEMAADVVNISKDATRSGFSEHEMAATIKNHMVEKYPADIWHCFVGRKFSCFVTCEESKFIYFYLGQTGVVVFAS